MLTLARNLVLPVAVAIAAGLGAIVAVVAVAFVLAGARPAAAEYPYGPYGGYDTFEGCVVAWYDALGPSLFYQYANDVFNYWC